MVLRMEKIDCEAATETIKAIDNIVNLKTPFTLSILTQEENKKYCVQKDTFGFFLLEIPVPYPAQIFENRVE